MIQPYDVEQDPLNILHNPNRSRAHAILRGLISGEAAYAEPLARYLWNGGDIHWRDAKRALHELKPEREAFQGCKGLVVAIRIALATADTVAIDWHFNGVTLEDA